MSYKVLMIINVDWYFDLHWLERARDLKKSGFKVIIATRFTSSALYQKYIKEGFACKPLPLNRFSMNIITDGQVLIRIRTIIKEIQPSIIHAITIKPIVYSGLINNNIPTIYSITGLGSTFSATALKFRLIKPLILAIYKMIGSRKRSFFLFENTDDFNRMKLQNVFTDNAAIIKGAGINENRFYYTPPPNNNTILFAARLLKAKGLYVLIDAIGLLQKSGINIKLKVAGIPDYKADSAMSMDEIKTLSNTANIEWLGNISDMPTAIRESEVICLPTEYAEGIPRVLIEAASSGRAIIATNVSGCREIVSHYQNGLLVPINNPKALACAIHQIIGNKTLSCHFGLMGRKKVLGYFSNKTVLKQTKALYRKLLTEANDYRTD